MGGNYFSNGIALNTIEHASSPGLETWRNINAIDDIVSFLVSDVSDKVPAFMQGIEPLCKRGIATVACVRGNAAAGGVALATACDVVLAGRGVVLNPSYRGMGLHGSELHSYVVPPCYPKSNVYVFIFSLIHVFISFSYLQRCGPIHAAEILREMKPLNTSLAQSYGLIDGQIGSSSQTVLEAEPLFVEAVTSFLTAKTPSAPFSSAPWARCSPSPLTMENKGASSKSWIDEMCTTKLCTYTTSRAFPPLHHYRTEELSQMLLDSFHPIRSQRYHTRRSRFVRKLKATGTPARYKLRSVVGHEGEEVVQDEEDKETFDEAPGWERGEEWGWVGMEVPESLKTSQVLRIPLYPSCSSPSSSSLSSLPQSPSVAKPSALDEESRQPSYRSTATSTSSSSCPDESLLLTPPGSSPPRLGNGGKGNGNGNGNNDRGDFAKKFTQKLRRALDLKKKIKSSKSSTVEKGNSIPTTHTSSVPPTFHPVLKRPLGQGEQASEWPCLVTGGEEWEGKRGDATEDGIKVENVA